VNRLFGEELDTVEPLLSPWHLTRGQIFNASLFHCLISFNLLINFYHQDNGMPKRGDLKMDLELTRPQKITVFLLGLFVIACCWYYDNIWIYRVNK
jgi:hypothetical protein